MGTSGAYGGSERQAWQRARALFDGVLSDDTDAGIPSLVQALAQALADEDPSSLHPRDDFEEPLPNAQTLPRLLVGLPVHLARLVSSGSGAGGGAAGGGTVLRAATPRGGRRGGSTRRSVARGARLGGRALAAGYALRRGDRAALGELGLDLDQLQVMSPRQQRLALLNATIGDATHPDDVAVRRAADEFLKQILTENPPTALDAVRGFVAALILRLGMVELKRQLDSGDIDPATASLKEKTIQDWIQARLRSEDFGLNGAIIAIADFQRTAATLAATALEILRAG